MLSGCTVPPDSKETEPGSSDQEASPSAGKITGVVLVPCRAWKCVPTAISAGVDFSEVPPWVSFLSEGPKIYFKDWCLMNSQPTFLFFPPI